MKFDKIEVSGLTVLFIGVVLLAFTFFSAYTFLSGNLAILISADLTQLFGNALGPLIEAVIRILYLGIMGWMGSILTIRSIQLLKREKALVPPQLAAKVETKQSGPIAVPVAAVTSKSVERENAVKESEKMGGQEITQLQESPSQTREL